MPKTKPKIVVATLVWDAVAVEFLLEWTRLWADFFASDWDANLFAHVSSSSLLPHARNMTCGQAFNEYPEFTHLLMVDSDVLGLRVKHIRRMVNHNVPIVSALVTRPKEPFRPACEDDDDGAAVHDEMLKAEPGIIERKWTGSGSILIRRDALEATGIVCEKYRGEMGTLWFREGREERIGWERDMERHLVEVTKKTTELIVNTEDTDDGRKEFVDKLAELHMESFLMGRGCWDGGIINGEDVDFGLRARALGFKSYVDCGIDLEHVSLRGYGIEDHLRCAGIEVKRENQSVIDREVVTNA